MSTHVLVKRLITVFQQSYRKYNKMRSEFWPVSEEQDKTGGDVEDGLSGKTVEDGDGGSVQISSPSAGVEDNPVSPSDRVMEMDNTPVQLFAVSPSVSVMEVEEDTDKEDMLTMSPFVGMKVEANTAKPEHSLLKENNILKTYEVRHEVKPDGSPQKGGTIKVSEFIELLDRDKGHRLEPSVEVMSVREVKKDSSLLYRLVLWFATLCSWVLRFGFTLVAVYFWFNELLYPCLSASISKLGPEELKVME